MRIGVLAFTARGGILAQRLAEVLRLDGHDVFASAGSAQAERTGLYAGGSLAEWTASRFDENDALVYIGAAGIAVRAVAPHLRSKLTDPAVISLDEMGRFVIPLVSGHVGGANRLAERIASIVGGVAAVSTATDVNGMFAVDEWIVRSGMLLLNPKAIRVFSSALLAGEEPGLCSEFPVIGPLPDGVCAKENGPTGVYIGIRNREPFDRTLVAVPRIVELGIGCRRGTPAEKIARAVDTVLSAEGIRPESVLCAASIDLKKDEEGLLAFCKDRNWSISFYPAELLAALKGDFTPSERVLRVTGVDNVCERAACYGGGRLIVRKKAHDGVTVAAAVRDKTIMFQGA